MPSTNEHYIPKFLLKGFASSTRRNQVYTWLFRHCLEPIETNTRNIGSEFDFYAGIANRNADTAIKPLERELAKYVGKLRRVTKEIRLTDTIVPELVVHVMLRNNCLRQAMIRLVQKTTEIMKARMQNQETLPRYALKAFSQRPAEFIAAFQEGARMAGLDQQWSLSMLDGLFRNPSNLSALATSSEMEEYFKDLNVFLSKNFAEFAKTSHVEGLLTATLPTQWVEAIEDWNWFLVIRDKGTFILGDVGPLFKVNGSTQYRSLPSSLHEFEFGYLPISDSRLLAGVVEGDSSDHLDAEALNMATSACSNHFFVSSKSTRREMKYLEVLGSSIDLIPDKELAPMLDHLFDVVPE